MLHPREDYARIQDPAGLIPEDEPVFLLRAQDKFAAETVRHWAVVNLNNGGDPKLCQMAFEFANKMDAWPVHKLADLPAETFPEQKHREAKEEIEGHKPDRVFKDGIEQQGGNGENQQPQVTAEQKMTKCPHCGKKLENPTKLAVHIRKRHQN